MTENDGSVRRFDPDRDPVRPPDHDWPVVESAAEYETGWYTGGYDRLRQPDGSQKDYFWADMPAATVVVALLDGTVTEDDRDRLVMVDQYRPTIREQCLELPAGVVEDGESYTAAGERELREETGFAPSSTSLVEEFWCSTGVLRHRRGIVFADGLEPVDPDLDDNEFLEVTTVPVKEALAVARREPANDATIEGILLSQAEGLF